MMDYERLLDDFINHDRAGDAEVWYSCRDAWLLYQHFPERRGDITQALMAACCKTSTAIYNRRDSWDEMTRLYPDDFGERELIVAPPLSYSHFYRLNHLRFGRDRPGIVPLTDKQAREYLESALTSDWSSDTMIARILGDAVLEDRIDGNELRRRQFATWSKQARKLIDKGGSFIPENVRMAVAAAILAVDAWIGEI